MNDSGAGSGSGFMREPLVPQSHLPHQAIRPGKHAPMRARIRPLLRISAARDQHSDAFETSALVAVSEQLLQLRQGLVDAPFVPFARIRMRIDKRELPFDPGQ